MKLGTLYIVATPIGNLEDITARAISTLTAVDLILCEDTRVTKNLLSAFEITTPTQSYHQHSDRKRILEIQKMLEEGKNIAVVTDAGTPGISDPGNVLVHDLVQANPGLSIVPIPGVSAVVAALSVSGFPTDKFLFLGFPPHKTKRQKFFREAAESAYTVVFYESGHRITKCLQELPQFFPADQPIVVCRELTKKFETLYRGSVGNIHEQTVDERGEFVVILSKI